MKNYGKELILDLHDCDPAMFTRKSIRKFLKTLVKQLDMHAETIHWWDYKGYPEEYKKAPDHLKGTSVIQFIRTSNITIHTLDVMKRMYINIFSCKDFDEKHAERLTRSWFEGRVVQRKVIDRI